MAEQQPVPGSGDIEQDEVHDGEKMAREELVRLNRQYRTMEMERMEHSLKSGTTVTLQRRQLIYFQNERDHLLDDLNNVISEKNQAEDKETMRIITDMVDNFRIHQKEIDSQLILIAELDEQVDKITRRVIEQNLKVAALFGHSMTTSQATKHQQKLENRLYRTTTEFDTQVSKNAVIRKAINMHLWERGRFHTKYRTIKKRIARMKRQMGDLVDIATSTYDQREECVNKIKALRVRNDKESRAHVLDMKEHHRLLQNDEKSRSFMETKSKRRPLIEEDDLRLRRHQYIKEKYYDDLLRSYRKGFREILKMSSSLDIQSLIQTYRAQEQLNFTRFQYLATVNCELDFLQRAVAELKAVIDVKAVEHKRFKLNQQKSLKVLEGQFQGATEQLNVHSRTLANATTNMGKMLASIQESFMIAECDKEPIMRLLGGDREKILPFNLNLCFKLLEYKIHKLQQEDALLEIRKAVEIDNTPISNVMKIQPPQQTTLGRKPMGGFIKPKIVSRLEPG